MFNSSPLGSSRLSVLLGSLIACSRSRGGSPQFLLQIYYETNKTGKSLPSFLSSFGFQASWDEARSHPELLLYRCLKAGDAQSPGTSMVPALLGPWECCLACPQPAGFWGIQGEGQGATMLGQSNARILPSAHAASPTVCALSCKTRLTRHAARTPEDRGTALSKQDFQSHFLLSIKKKQ